MSMHGAGQFDGPLQAYADGVVGGPPGATTEGELAAYKDGVFSGLGQQFFPGPDGPAARIAHAGMGVGPRPARLNPQQACLQALNRNCDLRFGVDTQASRDCFMSRRSGCTESWGRRSRTGASVKGVGEYFKPMQGVGEYFRPMSGMGEYFSTQGLGLFGGGSSGAEPLDLKNLAVLKEVKGAMALLFPQVLAGAPGTYNDKWFDSGIWDVPADALWNSTVLSLTTAPGPSAGRLDPATLSIVMLREDGTTAMWPNALGMRALLLIYTASPQYGPEYVEQNFPRLAAWAATPSTGIGTPQVSGVSRAKLARMAMWGALGMGALAVGVAVTRKKK